MTFYDIVAQVLGFMAMASSALTFQMRTYKRLMLMQMLTAVLFGVHFFMLDTTTGVLLNAVAIVRNSVFLNRDKKFFSYNWWTVLFAVAMVVVAVFFGWEGWQSGLFAAAMVCNTISFSMRKPQNVRKLILLCAPLALVYDIVSGSVGGICNEIMAMVSAVVGLIRYKNKEGNA